MHPDSHVTFDKRLYSVPWKHIGREVSVRGTPSSITIYLENQRIATHERRGKGARVTNEAHLPAGRVDYRHRGREHWMERAARIGEEVAELAREVFDEDEVISGLRKVQAIVKFLEGFPASRARAACRRASYFGSTNYRSIKNILRKALDFEPLPEPQCPEGEPSATDRRFARSPGYFTAPQPKEDDHGYN